MSDSYIIIDAESLINALHIIWLLLFISWSLYAFKNERRKKKTIDRLNEMTDHFEKLFKMPFKEARELVKKQKGESD